MEALQRETIADERKLEKMKSDLDQGAFSSKVGPCTLTLTLNLTLTSIGLEGPTSYPNPNPNPNRMAGLP